MKKLTNIFLLAGIILWNSTVHAQLQLPCLKDLVPYPPNQQSIVLFKRVGGSVMDPAGNSYHNVANTFCKDIYNNGQLNGGSVVGTDYQGGQVRELTITLPSFNWGVQFNSSLLLSASGVYCTLSQSGSVKQSLTGVTVTRSTQFASNAKTATYTGRGQRTVYMLTGESNTECWVRTVNANGSVPAGATDEANFTVKVNTGIPAFSECNSSNNAGSNNSKVYNYGGTSFRVGDENNSFEAAGKPLQIKLYPNPAQNEINLNIKSTERDFNVQLINIEGKIIGQQQITGEAGMAENTMDISGLSKGMYEIRVIGGNETAVKRFIKN